MGDKNNATIIRRLTIIKPRLWLLPLVLCVEMFSGAIVYSQTSHTDTLFALYENSKGGERLGYIYELIESDELPYSEMEKLSREALAMCRQDTSLDVGIAYYTRGVCFYDKKIKDSTFYYLEKVTALKDRTDAEILSRTYLYLIKSCFYISSDLIRADSLLNKLFELYRKNPDIANYGQYYLYLGDFQLRKNNLDSAIINYKIADSLFAAGKDTAKRIEVYATLSYLYFLTGNFRKSTFFLDKIMNMGEDEMKLSDKAFFYYLLLIHLEEFDIDEERQLRLCRKIEDIYDYFQDSVSSLYIQVKAAKLYLRQHDYDSALVIFNNALKISDQLNDEIEKAHCLHGLFKIYMHEKNPEKAIPLADSALGLLRKYSIIVSIRRIQLKLADYYSSIGEYGKAERFFDTLRRFVSASKYLDIKLNYMKYFADHLSRKGDFAAAFRLMREYAVENDSITRRENQSKLEKLYVLYRTREKERQNIILTQKLQIEQKQKNELEYHRKITLLSLFGVILILLIVIVMYVLLRKNALQRREINRRKILQLEQEKIISGQKLESNHNLLMITNNAFLQQSVFLDKVTNTLKSLRPYTNDKGRQEIMASLAEISNFSVEAQWNIFEKNLSVAYPDFMKKLKKNHPDLTVGEKRLSAFIKMGLSNTEITNITEQSPHSIYNLKKRLRNKMKISDNERLTEYIQSL